MRVIYDPAADALYIEVLPPPERRVTAAPPDAASVGDAFVELTYGDAVAGVELRAISRDLPPRGRVPTPDEVALLVQRRGITGVALADVHVVVRRAPGDRAEPYGSGNEPPAPRP